MKLAPTLLHLVSATVEYLIFLQVIPSVWTTEGKKPKTNQTEHIPKQIYQKTVWTYISISAFFSYIFGEEKGRRDGGE